MDVIDILTTYYPAFLRGFIVTMELSAIIWLSGLIFGGVVGVAGSHLRYSIGWPSKVLSFFLSGIPILVLLFWLHYPAQALFDIVVDPFWTSALALSIVNVFAVADLVRGALSDFPQHYLTAAKVTGLSKKQTIFKIQLPLILREIIPPLLLLQVIMLHTTLFASLISVEEIFRVAQRVNAQIYRPVEVYSAIGVFFLMISLPVNGLAFWLKKRFTRDLSEQ